MATFVDRDGHRCFERDVHAAAGGGADVTDCGQADAIRRELLDGQVGAGDCPGADQTEREWFCHGRHRSLRRRGEWRDKRGNDGTLGQDIADVNTP